MFLSDELKVNTSFYGSGETFLFYFDSLGRIHAYEGKGINEYYIYSDMKILAFGCSNNSFALCIDQDFLKGYTKETETFDNKPLTNKETFYVLKLEIWAFDEKA